MLTIINILVHRANARPIASQRDRQPPRPHYPPRRHRSCVEPSAVYLGPYTAVDIDGTATVSAGPGALELVTWLKLHELLDVTDGPATTIAGSLATVVDITPSPTSTYRDADCPFPSCIAVIDYPLWSGWWPITTGVAVRLWAVDLPAASKNNITTTSAGPDRKVIPTLGPVSAWRRCRPSRRQVFSSC